jgi:hypothetical protein
LAAASAAARRKQRFILLEADTRNLRNMRKMIPVHIAEYLTREQRVAAASLQNCLTFEKVRQCRLGVKGQCQSMCAPVRDQPLLCQRLHSGGTLAVKSEKDRSIKQVPMPQNANEGLCMVQRTSNECNPFFASAFLRSDGLWDCEPRFPALVAKRSLSSPEVDNVVACMQTGATPATQQRLVQLDENMKVVSVWTQHSNFTPDQCVCAKCPTGFVSSVAVDADYALKLPACVPDPCQPGEMEFDDEWRLKFKRCNCPPGFVQCPSDALDKLTEWPVHCPMFSDSVAATCVPDPCLPFGRYNTKSGRCDCDPSRAALFTSGDKDDKLPARGFCRPYRADVCPRQ